MSAQKESSDRRIVVGFSGGVTSAWCAGWALRSFAREEVVLLWHDTRREHEDTYRFVREMSAALGVFVIERSDGRDVVEVFRDEGFLGNNQNAMCSRILKQEQGDKYVRELQADGHDVVRIFGFGVSEVERRQRAAGRAEQMGYLVRFPVAEEGVSKQVCADWCRTLGVRPSAMYEWSDHANCVGCVKGGKAYWLAVAEHAPETFAEFSALEEEFGHGILRGGGREHHLLKDLVQVGLKRPPRRRERIEIGPCECGD